MSKPIAHDATIAVVWLAIITGVSGCDGVLGIDGIRYGCTEGKKQCAGDMPQTCDAPGRWVSQAACDAGQHCEAGECFCNQGTKQCAGNMPQTCDANGQWKDDFPEPCINKTCIGGACEGDCVAGTKQCVEDTPRSCDGTGHWVDGLPCPKGQRCQGGRCVVECTEGDLRCWEETNTPQYCDMDGKWQNMAPCENQTCIAAECEGVCAPGQTQCNSNTVQSCNKEGDWQDNMTCQSGCANGKCTVCTPTQLGCSTTNAPQQCNNSGQWEDIAVSPCMNTTCIAGECKGVCAPGQKQCIGQMPQSCDPMGEWKHESMCINQTCVAGACIGECAPGQKQCMGQVLRSCDPMGQWNEALCINKTCISGACIGECAPGQGQCNGGTPQYCDTNAQWQDGTACLGACVAGTCPGPSCAGLENTCGPPQKESCCASSVIVGGTYNRSNDPAYPATVSDFRLDRFEVTVGRFRKFVEAYPASKPSAGAGAHPLIANSGWVVDWDTELPADQDELKMKVKCNPAFQTWTDLVGGNEHLPVNCISWYMAFAFCAWDGGRLPTEAEWNYAAAGGGEQRVYPWSNPPISTVIDGTYAVYGCFGDGNPINCAFGDIVHVGSKSPKGDGKWGQTDLGGSMWEWNLDGTGDYISVCDNCANLQSDSSRVIRGGNWDDSASYLLSSGRYDFPSTGRDKSVGVRCARIL